MKKVFLCFAAMFIAANLFAQMPEKMSYQAVIRNGSDQLVANQNIGMKISILQNTESGNVVYVETQAPTSNNNGLITIEIGTGNVVSGSFSEIAWAAGIYFLKTEIDPTGGSNYSIETTQQLLSIPYAFHAKTAESLTGEIVETDPVFSAWDKSTGISITESQISNLQNYLTTEIDPAFSAWDKTTGIVITESQITDLQSYLTAETDPTFTAWDKSTGISITENQISDLQDYLTAEIDPAFSAWDKTTGIVITESQISDLQTYITTELDPIYAESIAAGITETDTANWNAKISQETQTLEQVVALSNAANDRITNLTDPIAPQDAVTKSYVDAFWESLDIRIALLESNIPEMPTVSSVNITKITKSSAVSGGNITGDGGAVILSRGVCWDTVPNPTISDNYSFDGIGSGEYTSNLTNLMPNTTYYVRPYAINYLQTGYGEETSFTTRDTNCIVVYGDGVTDIDGNYYESVIIGNQEWMASDLKTTKFNDGTDIPYVADNDAWVALTTPGYSVYIYSDSLAEIYDSLHNWCTHVALYNWYAVDDTDSGNLKICPVGWHVSTDIEWMLLAETIGGSDKSHYLKSTTGWANNGNGIDIYGFSVLPGGWRSVSTPGLFDNMFNNSRFWTSTRINETKAWMRTFNTGNTNILRNTTGYGIKYGFSVRCVKDQN